MYILHLALIKTVQFLTQRKGEKVLALKQQILLCGICLNGMHFSNSKVV